MKTITDEQEVVIREALRTGRVVSDDVARSIAEEYGQLPYLWISPPKAARYGQITEDGRGNLADYDAILRWLDTDTVDPDGLADRATELIRRFEGSHSDRFGGVNHLPALHALRDWSESKTRRIVIEVVEGDSLPNGVMRKTYRVSLGCDAVGIWRNPDTVVDPTGLGMHPSGAVWVPGPAVNGAVSMLDDGGAADFDALIVAENLGPQRPGGRYVGSWCPRPWTSNELESTRAIATLYGFTADEERAIHVLWTTYASWSSQAVDGDFPAEWWETDHRLRHS